MDNLFSSCGTDNNGFREMTIRILSILKAKAKAKYQENAKYIRSLQKLEIKTWKQQTHNQNQFIT